MVIAAATTVTWTGEKQSLLALRCRKRCCKGRTCNDVPIVNLNHVDVVDGVMSVQLAIRAPHADTHVR